MAYNEKDFVIESKIYKDGYDYKRTANIEIFAQNKSSIEIASISVSYHSIDKDGVTRDKYTTETRNISPNEKREIFRKHISYSLGVRTLNVTDITVRASDGTVFKVTPPPGFSFSSSYSLWGKWMNSRDMHSTYLKRFGQSILCGIVAYITFPWVVLHANFWHRPIDHLPLGTLIMLCFAVGFGLTAILNPFCGFYD